MVIPQERLDLSGILRVFHLLPLLRLFGLRRNRRCRRGTRSNISPVDGHRAAGIEPPGDLPAGFAVVDLQILIAWPEFQCKRGAPVSAPRRTTGHSYLDTRRCTCYLKFRRKRRDIELQRLRFVRVLEAESLFGCGGVSWLFHADRMIAGID